MGEGSCAASEVTFAAAHRYAVLFGFHIPACVPPVRIIVNATTLQLWGWNRVTCQGDWWRTTAIKEWKGTLLSYLPLHIVNGSTLGIAVGAVVVIKHILDRTINIVFHLGDSKESIPKHTGMMLWEIRTYNCKSHALLTDVLALLVWRYLSRAQAHYQTRPSEKQTRSDKCVCLSHLCSVNVPDNHHCHFCHKHQHEDDDKLWIAFQDTK